MPGGDYSHLGLSDAEAATLLSLEQMDDYPLYTMRHYPQYGYEEYTGSSAAAALDVTIAAPWACTLFAALASPDSKLFGRNFDWTFSPTLLLFTDPPDGYAAASLVDLAYLGFGGASSQGLTTRPIEDLTTLLDAHNIPFDGLNEAGLAIGMAAVAPGNMPSDPDKESIGSLGIIRVVLDKAATVDEAIEILSSYNIDFEGGPPLHYLVADNGGETAVVEYYQGEIHVIRSETGWYQASNFIESTADPAHGQCRRYDLVAEELDAVQGVLDFDGAFGILEKVAQAETQWSVVYNQTSGEIRVVMGKQYDRVHVFQLDP